MSLEPKRGAASAEERLAGVEKRMLNRAAAGEERLIGVEKRMLNRAAAGEERVAGVEEQMLLRARAAREKETAASDTYSAPVRPPGAAPDAPAATPAVKPTATPAAIPAAKPAARPADPYPRARPPSASSVWRELLSLGVKLVLIALAFTLAFTFLYGLHRNLDPDMVPAVKDGDLVMFYRLDRKYAAGDLLVLSFEGAWQVRRVVAVAGDTVDVTEAGLTVNGALQQEPEIYEPTLRYEGGAELPLTLGEEQVFVLGDGRSNATDSRVYGPVNVKDTLGTVIAVLRRRNV
jgi:signal peptidase I